MDAQSATAAPAADTELADLLAREAERQRLCFNLIASENYVSPAVLAAQGSVLTNKYAEGYPGHRHYPGCEIVDDIERLAVARACRLFGAEHANVQPATGAVANLVCFSALLKPGDTILTLQRFQGGHYSHALEGNLTAQLYRRAEYELHPETWLLDLGAARAAALQHKPKIICIGYSWYPPKYDPAPWRVLADEVGALLLGDVAHLGGLICTGLHPDPVPYCDVLTFTTHKTLRGPRGGLILCRGQFAERIDAAMAPGIQGGPPMHVIAAKAACFGEAMTIDFRSYMERVLANCRALGEALQANGIPLAWGGTETHLLMGDLRPLRVDAMTVERALARAGILSNGLPLPNESWDIPMHALRLGPAAVTTRGMGVAEMQWAAERIAAICRAPQDATLITHTAAEVRELCSTYPLFAG